MKKRDFLSECNDQGVALQDFDLAFCQRCHQPECSRSQFGKSLFEQRVSTWEERLFTNPSKLSDTDPRLIQIRAKSFVDVPVSKSITVAGGWLDPNDLAPQGGPEPPARQALVTTEVPSKEGVSPVLNSPKPPPVMLGGASAPVTPPPKDAWQSKAVSVVEPGVQKVGPGAKIRFGTK